MTAAEAAASRRAERTPARPGHELLDELSERTAREEPGVAADP